MNILLLTGTCGVGKSTTSLTWANSRSGCIIEGDTLRCWIRDKAFRRSNDYQEDFMFKTVKLLGEQYAKLNRDIVIDYVWKPSYLESLHEFFSTYGIVQSVWLKCSAAENSRRDKLRDPSCVMGERVHELRDELEASVWPKFVHQLDTTHLNITETVEKINTYFSKSSES